MTDRSRGGAAAFDVYLEKPVGRPLEVTADVPMFFDFADRATAFAVLDPELPAGCARRSLLAEAWARAGLYGVDVGANDALASSSAAYVAWLVEPCEPMILGAIDDYQANPQRAVSSEGYARGAMLFPWFIQTQYGAPHSVDLLHALWLYSQQRTPPGNFSYVNRPDFIDVLRSLQKDRGATLADLLLEYSIARAFVGDRDDGIHMPDSTWLGRAGRVRFDGRVDYASLPQWIRPVAPIEPSGATYLWVNVKGAPKNASIGFRAEWETPTVFRFAFMKIGADGTELSRLAPISQEKATQLDVNVEDFSGAEALLIVGANVGAIAGDFKYDPDEMPLEPQGYLITLVAQH
ncbi:MAG: hypothetical protein HY898_10480 [Deltaproteobacteria bacterium]|nr:hypothetical protein [Deltaproteobacteria bacterium]